MLCVRLEVEGLEGKGGREDEEDEGVGSSILSDFLRDRYGADLTAPTDTGQKPPLSALRTGKLTQEGYMQPPEMDYAYPPKIQPARCG